MAIYHLSAKPVQRSKGRSVTAAIAYRAGCVIEDKRTGLKHDYTKKKGVIFSEIIVPDGINKPDRNELWNWAELAERRKDACVAKEYEVNLPHELNDQQRIALAIDFSKFLADTHQVAVDFSIHKPTQRDIAAGADPRNYHAHVMTSVRKISNDGLGGKIDIEKAGQKRKAALQVIRETWAKITNKHLEAAGLEERIDHRSLREQRSNRKPTIKMGWKLMAAERAGHKTVKGDINRAIRADNEEIAQLEKDIYLLKGRQQARNRFSKDNRPEPPKPTPTIKPTEQPQAPQPERLTFAQRRELYNQHQQEKVRQAAQAELERQQKAQAEHERIAAQQRQAELERQRQEQAERERVAAQKRQQEQAERERIAVQQRQAELARKNYRGFKP